jgi:hypothetical protein
MGIEEVVVIEDLAQLDYVRGQSVHDYDVYMELRLKEKLGELPKLRIILLPSEMSLSQAQVKVIDVLEELL